MSCFEGGIFPDIFHPLSRVKRELSVSTFRVLLPIFSFLVFFVPGYVAAFSLGEFQVLSKPDQPFHAAIPVELDRSEEIISVEMGAVSDYSLLNLPRSSVVGTLTPKIQREGQQIFIQLKSAFPVQVEDYYILLRVSSNKHTYFPFFRVYTPRVVVAKNSDDSSEDSSENVPVEDDSEPTPRILDTPSDSETNRAPIQPPIVQQEQNVQDTLVASLEDSPALEEEVIPSVGLTGGDSLDSYGPVREGETLTQIARLVRKKTSVTVFQAMQAILERNSNHFIRSNMNGLMAGSVLIIPPREEMLQIDNLKARTMRLQQAREWRVFMASKRGSKPSSVATPVRREPTPPQREPTPPQEEEFVVNQEEERVVKRVASVSVSTPSKSVEREVKDENGSLKAILSQLQVITTVLERNQHNQEQVAQRVTNLEQARKTWDLMAGRVATLEKRQDQLSDRLVDKPTPSLVPEPSPTLPIVDESHSSWLPPSWPAWGGFAVAGFALFLSLLLIGLGRFWSRSDRQKTLDELLSSLAKKDPDVLRKALEDTEPVYEHTFEPKVQSVKLEGGLLGIKKESISDTLSEKASKLRSMTDL